MSAHIVYRISRAKRAGDLSGEGSRRVGGRWNSLGVRALYTSESIALSQLEVLVHVQLTSAYPANYVTTVIEIHEEISERLEYSTERASNSQTLGDELLGNQSILGFWVPSIIVPTEYNLVLNPVCDRFLRAVRIRETFEQRIDPRLLGQ